MSRYANGTQVAIERTEAEIKRTLMRYSADDVVTGMSSRRGVAFVQFVYDDLQIEARIPIPKQDAEEFQLTPRGRDRSESVAFRDWEKACQQQWRILLLLIKAKLEAIENRVVTPEQEFLPWLMLPDSRTVGAALEPDIRKALAGGNVPLLPAFTDRTA